MQDFMDWKPRAKLVLEYKYGYMSLANLYGELPTDVLFGVLENTADFLKKNHKDLYMVFLDNTAMAYRFTLSQQAEEKAKTAVGDPAALIQFPGRTQNKEAVS